MPPPPPHEYLLKYNLQIDLRSVLVIFVVVLFRMCKWIRFASGFIFISKLAKQKILLINFLRFLGV